MRMSYNIHANDTCIQTLIYVARHPFSVDSLPVKAVILDDSPEERYGVLGAQLAMAVGKDWVAEVAKYQSTNSEDLWNFIPARCSGLPEGSAGIEQLISNHFGDPLWYITIVNRSNA